MLDELFEALFERRKKKHSRWADDDWGPRRRPPRRYEDDDGPARRSARPAREGCASWDDDWEERRRYSGWRSGPAPKRKPWWKKLGDLLEFGD